MSKLGKFAAACVAVLCGFSAFGALTSQSYRGSGLIAQWDAIDNAIDADGNRYHDPAATVWKDLSGNGYDLVVTGGSWPEDGRSLKLSGGKAWRSGNLQETINTTETCFHTPSARGWGFGMSYCSSPKRYVYFQTETDIMSVDYKVYAAGESVLNRDVCYQYVYSAPQKGILNGVEKSESYFNDWWGGAAEVNIGSRNGGNGSGTVYAVRLYSEMLLADDLAWNQAVDDIRYFGGKNLKTDLGAVTLVSASDVGMSLNVESVKWHRGSDRDGRTLFADWRKQGDESWQEVACLASFAETEIHDVKVAIVNLDSSTAYEVRLRAKSMFGGEWTSETIGVTNVFETAAPNANPTLQIDCAHPFIGTTGLEIPMTIDSFGTGASCLTALTLSIGTEEGVYDHEESIPVEGLVVGETSLPVGHFTFGTTYFARLVAENDLAGRAEVVFSFVAPNETYGSEYRRGLWQVKFVPGVNTLTCGGLLKELSTDPHWFDVMGIAEGEKQTDRQLVEGAIMAYAPPGNDVDSVYTSEMTGRTYCHGSPATFAYEGYMLLEAGKTYVFGGDLYDASRCYIDNVQIFYQEHYGEFSSGTYLCERTGWHPIRVYLGHASGKAGNVVGRGFVWHESGAEERRLIDTDGRLLAVGLVDGATESKVAVERLARVGNRLVAKIRMTDPALINCRFYAYVGEHYGAMTKMPGMVELDSADGRVAVCDMEVPEGVNHVRFAAETECFGEKALCWAPSILWQETSESDSVAPMMVSASSDCHVAGGDVAVSGRVFSIGEGTEVRVTLGGVEKTAVVDDYGGFSAVFDGVDESVAQEAVVEVSDANGTDSLALEPFAFVRESIFSGKLTLGTTSGRQRDLLATARVDALGVGATDAVLLLGPNAEHLAEAQRLSLTGAGDVLFSVKNCRWDETVFAQVVFETTSGGSGARHETSVASCQVKDRSTYSWKSTVGEGDWSEPANWTSSIEDCVGYPTNSASSAEFVSKAKVRVDARYSIANLRLSTANVELWSDDTNRCSLTTADHMSPGSGTRVIFNRLVFTDNYFSGFRISGYVGVTNGAVVTMGPLNGGGGTMHVCDGSTLSIGGRNENGMSLVVDDSTVVITGNYPLDASSLTFRGRRPRVEVVGSNVGLGSKAGVSGASIRFEIPKDGYATIPLVGMDKRAKLFDGCDSGWARIVVSGSKDLRRLQHQPLIVWDGGIATSNCTAEAVAIKGCGFEYSEKAGPSYRPWCASPEGLSVKTVGFHGVKAGLAITIR